MAFGLAVAFAGCGATAEVPPDEVARDFVTSNAPAKCRLLTPELLEQQTGRRGPAALRFCERNVVRFPAARDVRVLEAEVAGPRAQVELVADGSEERFELVRTDEGWRIAAAGG